MTPFIHLRAYSDYSIGQSMVKPSDLAEFCLNQKMPALGIADRGNLFGALEFSNECVKRGIKPLIGCALKVDYLSDKNKWHSKSKLPQAIECGELLFIAKDQEGYSNLLRLVSKSFLDTAESSIPHIRWDDLFQYSKGLVILCGGLESPISILHAKGLLEEARTLLKQLHAEYKDNLFIELMRFKDRREHQLEHFLLKQAYEFNIPIVATNAISFLRSTSYEAMDALICIAGGHYLLEDTRAKAEADHYFKTPEEMMQLFSDLPEAIDNTILIASKCSVFPENRQPMLPKFSAEIKDEAVELEAQVTAGLKKRIMHIQDQEVRERYFARLAFELKIINKMQFPGYFLIVSDFVKWSKANGIPVGPGRGSGVGSIVAWSLEITDLDPIHFGLLFERFLNPERISMPDFDIDFCQERRDEVINYVRNRYGEELVAQIITFGKLQARAVLRDVGRVLQMPYTLVDRISKLVPHNPANPITLEEAIRIDKELQAMRDSDPDVKKLLAMSLELEGVNRHVSTHAAGIVIGDRPLIELVPLYQDANSTMPVVQFSLKYAESAGLMKFDFLGLKTLSVIDKTIGLVKNTTGLAIDLATISLEDRATYEMLSQGHTVGIFQFEGAGMKEAIKQLKPDKIDDLIALGSLYRPGPMDNIPSYINRKHGLEQIEYIHPLLQDALKETYGIIIYQEQVMQIAQILAGYSLGEADILRKAMGKKNKQEMEEQKEGFISRAIANGLEQAQAEGIFTFVEKFASYGFNKSHAAAYAVISYQTAYLKTHYTAEFLVASINLEIQDSNKIAMFCRDAKKFSIELLPPDINYSSPYFTIIDSRIRFGLAGIKNVGVKATTLIDEERVKGGHFTDIFDFIQRCGSYINKRLLENLVKSGAFDSIYKNRHELLINIDLLLHHGCAHSGNENDTKQHNLFGNINQNRPELKAIEDFNIKDKSEAEFEALGLYMSSHPLDNYEKLLAKLGVVEARSIEAITSKQYVKRKIAGIVVSKKIRSSKRGKYAFLQIADQSSVLDVSVFNDELLTQYGEILQEGKLIMCEVGIRKDDNGLRIVIEKVSDLYTVIENAITGYNVYIKSREVIPMIYQNLTSKGFRITLYAALPDGSILKFDNDNPLYINQEGVKVLKSMSSLEVIEY